MEQLAPSRTLDQEPVKAPTYESRLPHFRRCARCGHRAPWVRRCRVCGAPGRRCNLALTALALALIAVLLLIGTL